MQGAPRLEIGHTTLNHTKKNLFTAIMNLEAELVKAIDIICQRKRKAPNIEPIHLHLEKNKSYADNCQVMESLDELVDKGRIEDRGRNDDHSYFIINNEIIPDKELYVKHSEFIALHNEVEQLKNTSKDNGTSKTKTNPHELREETALLRKENESLKTELRWKDHMLLNIQNAQLPEPANV